MPNSPDTYSSEKPSLKQKMLLGLGFFCLVFMDKSSEVLAVPFYQMTLGVDPFLFSIVLTIPIIVSAICIPWVGHFSDNLQSRWGRRRPLIFIAAWSAAFCFGFKWMVPVDWSPNEQLFYFFILSIVFQIAFSFYSVPLHSLSYELTSDESERIKVMEIKSYFIKVGAISAPWLYPLASLAMFGGVIWGVQVIGWAAAIVVIGLLGMVPAIFIKEKVREATVRTGPQLGVLANMKSIIALPIVKLVLTIAFLQVGIVAFAAKMDYYVLVYGMFGGDISEGAVWKAFLSMGYAITAAIYIPIISLLSRRFGMIITMQIVFAMNAVGGLLKWFVYSPGVTWLLLLDPIFCSAIWSSMTIVIPAIVARASDIDAKQQQHKRTGRFAATLHWGLTLSSIFALLVSGYSLNLIGFDAALGAEQSAHSLILMKSILALGTFLPSVVAVFMLNKFRISHPEYH